MIGLRTPSSPRPITGEGFASLPFGILLGFGSYLTAARLPRRISIPAVAASAEALGGVIGYTALAVRSAAPVIEAGRGLLPLAAAWFIGDSVAVRRRYQVGLAAQQEREQERERATEAERGRHQSKPNGSASLANCTMS